MLDFKWDELDFLTVLEVEPEYYEDNCSYLYIVEKDGLRLEVCVFSYIGDISIFLYRQGDDAPFVRLPLAQCREASRVFDKRGEFLERFSKELIICNLSDENVFS